MYSPFPVVCSPLAVHCRWYLVSNHIQVLGSAWTTEEFPIRKRVGSSKYQKSHNSAWSTEARPDETLPYLQPWIYSFLGWEGMETSRSDELITQTICDRANSSKQLTFFHFTVCLPPAHPKVLLTPACQWISYHIPLKTCKMSQGSPGTFSSGHCFHSKGDVFCPGSKFIPLMKGSEEVSRGNSCTTVISGLNLKVHFMWKWDSSDLLFSLQSPSLVYEDEGDPVWPVTTGTTPPIDCWCQLHGLKQELKKAGHSRSKKPTGFSSLWADDQGQCLNHLAKLHCSPQHGHCAEGQGDVREALGQKYSGICKRWRHTKLSSQVQSLFWHNSNENPINTTQEHKKLHSRVDKGMENGIKVPIQWRLPAALQPPNTLYQIRWAESTNIVGPV